MLPLVGFRGARESARTWPQGSVVAVSARGSGVFRSCNQALLVSDRDNAPRCGDCAAVKPPFDLRALRMIRTESLTRSRRCSRTPQLPQRNTYGVSIDCCASRSITVTAC